MTEPTFALYVSINPETPVPVSRFGSGIAGSRSNTLIGGERDLMDPRKINYNPERVVGILTREYGAYRREYNRALKKGDLVKRTREDFLMSQAAEVEAEKVAGEQRVAEKKAKKEKAEALAKKIAETDAKEFKATNERIAKAEKKRADKREARAAKAAVTENTGNDEGSKAPKSSKSTKASK